MKLAQNSDGGLRGGAVREDGRAGGCRGISARRAGQTRPPGCRRAARYASIDTKGTRRVYDNLDVWFGPDHYRSTLYATGEEVTFYFVDCPPLYDRKGFYGDANQRLPRQ